LQVLVGFADKLRLLSVLMDDLKVLKEVRLKAHQDMVGSAAAAAAGACRALVLSNLTAVLCCDMLSWGRSME
jgi:hypothetical protein